MWQTNFHTDLRIAEAVVGPLIADVFVLLNADSLSDSGEV